MRLIAATRNRAKAQELARILAGAAEVAPLPIDAADPPEEGNSFEENAIAKAVYWSGLLDRGELVVGTDGGLLIPALGDRWDPLRTRRFAVGAADDVERAEALLALAEHLDGDQRRIAWQEVLAVARDGATLASWSATGEPGVLAHDVDPVLVAAGKGFWVPAVWICPDRGGRRLAELTPEELAARTDHWRLLGENLRVFLSQRH